MFEFMKFILHSKFFLVVLVLLLLYIYFKVVLYSYWKKNNVLHEKPIVPLGTLSTKFVMKKINLGNFLRESYEKFKQHRYHGLYMLHVPVLMISDLELIKQVLVKDFSNFSDHGTYHFESFDLMSGNLFFLSGDKWRTLRMKLTPTFTSGKLKQMFPLVVNIADELVKAIDKDLKSSNILEIKDFAARYTIDTICSLAFGVESQTLRDPDNPFRYYAELSHRMSPTKSALTLFAPGILRALRLPPLNTEATDFFKKLFIDMINKRKTESIIRNDFLNLLINLIENEQIEEKEASKNKYFNHVSTKLEPVAAAAQAFVFFAGGHETSSSVISHCLYELALNSEVQEKLQNEIDNQLRINNEMNFENIKDLEYLDMVFNETLRKHPSLPFLNRECTKDYKIPNSNLIIPKGMQVLISVSGLHQDSEIYSNPERFDPTRFNKENTASRNSFSFLPFGEGPRVCIGKRLGIIQTKVALFALLSKYKFSVCEKTTIPNEYSTETVLQSPKSGVYLHVEKRNEK